MVVYKAKQISYINQMDLKKERVFVVLSIMLLASLSQSQTTAAIPYLTIPAAAGEVFTPFLSPQVIKTTQAAGPTTTFTLYYFDSAQPNNFGSKATTAISGSWSYLAGTNPTFTCGLIRIADNSAFSLLKVGTSALTPLVLPTGVVTQLEAVRAAYVTALSASNTDPDSILKIGDNCANIAISNVLYNVHQTTGALTAVTLPTGAAALLAGTSNFQVAIFTGGLYRWSTTLSSYVKLATLPTTLTNYKVSASGSGIFVIGWVGVRVATGAGANDATNFAVYIFSSNATATTQIETFSDQYNTVTLPLFQLSARLTKLAIAFIKPGQNTLTVIARTVDYKNRVSSPVVFKDPTQLAVPYALTSPFLTFSDSFIYLRSGAPANEHVFQFVGLTVIRLKTGLLASVPGDWRNSFLDPMQTQNAVLFSSYLNINNNYIIYTTNFGSLRTNLAPMDTTLPTAALTVTVPVSATEVSLANTLSWTFIVTTTLTAVEGSVTTPAITLPAAGYTVYSQGSSCKLVSNAANYFVYRKDGTTSIYSLFNDATSVVGGATGIASSNVFISSDCQRIQAGTAKSIYLYSGTAYALLTITPSAQLTVDRDLLVGVSSSQIFAFRTTNFVSVLNDTLFTTSKVWTSPRGAIIYTQKANTAVPANVDVAVFVYSMTATTFTKVFTFTATFVGAAPALSVANDMTTFCMRGDFMNAGGLTIKSIAVDFINNRFTLIELIPGTITISASPYDVLPTASFIYIREKVSANAANEFVLSIQFGKAKVIYTNAITDSAIITLYVRPIVREANQVLTLLVEERNAQVITVKPRAFFFNLPPLNPNEQGAVVVGTNTFACPPGCSSCSGASTCTVCSTGFLLNTNKLCDLCGPFCVTCSAIGTCVTCQDGTYLKTDNKCEVCTASLSCFKCSLQGTVKCTVCPPGKLLDASAGTCSACTVKNCRTCSTTAGQCSQCFNGYALTTGTNLCVPCASTCTSCAVADVTVCSACAANQELVSGKCVRCPQYCSVCSSGLCVTCQPGFTANNGVCSLSCQPPCLTCVSGQPLTCLSCFSGATLVNGVCTPSLACLTGLTCTVCPYGYILVAGGCYQCNTGDANCVQCSVDNSQICVACKAGFYVDQTTSVCTACEINCRVCTTSVTCTSCVDGYTLLGTTSASVCTACLTPCLTCMTDAKICTTCVSGFILNGWKCLKNLYVGFRIVLNTVPATVLAGYVTVLNQLLTILGQTDADFIVFNEFTSGSTITTGSVVATSSTAATQATLSTGLAGTTTLGGFPITSVSLTASDAVAANDNALAIGLGVGIPLGVLLIVGIIVYCVCFKKKGEQTRPEHEPVAETSMTNMANQKAAKN